MVLVGFGVLLTGYLAGEVWVAVAGLSILAAALGRATL